MVASHIEVLGGAEWGDRPAGSRPPSHLSLGPVRMLRSLELTLGLTGVNYGRRVHTPKLSFYYYCIAQFHIHIDLQATLK